MVRSVNDREKQVSIYEYNLLSNTNIYITDYKVTSYQGTDTDIS